MECHWSVKNILQASPFVFIIKTLGSYRHMASGKAVKEPRSSKVPSGHQSDEKHGVWKTQRNAATLSVAALKSASQEKIH